MELTNGILKCFDIQRSNPMYKVFKFHRPTSTCSFFGLNANVQHYQNPDAWCESERYRLG